MDPIKIACEGAALVALQEMDEFQDDLKSLSDKNYEKLKTEIIETGIGFPIRLWRHDGRMIIIGGHQTRRTLLRMKEKGFNIPDRVPVSFVEARSYDEAKRRVLQDISQYGEISRQGLYQYMHHAEFDMSFIRDKFDLPNVDMESFEYEFFKDAPIPEVDEISPETRSEVVDRLRQEDHNPLEHDKNTYLNNNIKQVVLFYEGPAFEDVINRANLLLAEFNLDNFSALFLKLIEREENRDANLGVDYPVHQPEGAEQEVSPGDGYDEDDCPADPV